VALPTDLSTVRVYGTYVRLDDGQPATGTIRFTPRLRGPLTSDGVEVAVLPTYFEVELDETGSFDIMLPATNDPDYAPDDWTYLVTAELDTWLADFDILVPWDSVAISLPDATPVAVADGHYHFVKTVNGVAPDENGDVAVSGGTDGAVEVRSTWTVRASGVVSTQTQNASTTVNVWA
jgi:hypothetical protein